MISGYVLEMSKNQWDVKEIKVRIRKLHDFSPSVENIHFEGQDFVSGNKMNGRIAENDKLLSRDPKLDLGNQRVPGLVQILINNSETFLQNCPGWQKVLSPKLIFDNHL